MRRLISSSLMKGPRVVNETAPVLGNTWRSATCGRAPLSKATRSRAALIFSSMSSSRLNIWPSTISSNCSKSRLSGFGVRSRQMVPSKRPSRKWPSRVATFAELSSIRCVGRCVIALVPSCVRKSLRQPEKVVVGKSGGALGMNQPIVIRKSLCRTGHDVKACGANQIGCRCSHRGSGCVQFCRHWKGGSNLRGGLFRRRSHQHGYPRWVQGRLRRFESEVFDCPTTDPVNHARLGFSVVARRICRMRVAPSYQD